MLRLLSLPPFFFFALQKHPLSTINPFVTTLEFIILLSIQWFKHIFMYPSIIYHFFIQAFIHLFVSSTIHPSIILLMHPSIIHSFIQPAICPFIHVVTDLFISSLIHLFIHWFFYFIQPSSIHLSNQFIYPSIHPFTSTSWAH